MRIFFVAQHTDFYLGAYTPLKGVVPVVVLKGVVPVPINSS